MWPHASLMTKHVSGGDLSAPGIWKIQSGKGGEARLQNQIRTIDQNDILI